MSQACHTSFYFSLCCFNFSLLLMCSTLPCLIETLPCGCLLYFLLACTSMGGGLFFPCLMDSCSGSAPACGLLSWSLPDLWVFACPCCVIPRPGLHSRMGGGSIDSMPMRKGGDVLLRALHPKSRRDRALTNLFPQCLLMNSILSLSSSFLL